MFSWLFRLPIAAGLRQSLATQYQLVHFRRDLIAGITVGIIAIPLGMALAIASGAPPQYGLYTCVIAGIVMALTGGSRLSISGPTAAFVVILYPITQEFGIAGLLIATVMAGIMMVLMGIAKMGKLIEYIPVPVILGFTSGIAVVIATLQIKDFAGLTLNKLPANYVDKIITLWHALASYQPSDLIVGVATLSILIIWPKLPFRFPGHLVALGAGTTLGLYLTHQGTDIRTIGSLFSYQIEGQTLSGIPAIAPQLLLPWTLPGPEGKPLIISLSLLQQLFIPAVSIALLGAIESLLCAVISDGMSGHRHHANSELFGQGLANIIAPFFGGITATAAIARTVANYKAGAYSPISSIIHALVVLLAILYLSPFLSYLPMASLAALLLIVAFNMSELPKVIRLLRISSKGDRILLITTFILTISVDMVAAVSVGIMLAALIFLKRMNTALEVQELIQIEAPIQENHPNSVCILKISGPLFFAGAERILQSIPIKERKPETVIFYLDAVPLIDATGITCLEAVIKEMQNHNIRLVFSNLQAQPLTALARAGINQEAGKLQFETSLEKSLNRLNPDLAINLA